MPRRGAGGAHLSAQPGAPAIQERAHVLLVMPAVASHPSSAFCPLQLLPFHSHLCLRDEGAWSPGPLTWLSSVLISSSPCAVPCEEHQGALSAPLTAPSVTTVTLSLPCPHSLLHSALSLCSWLSSCPALLSPGLCFSQSPAEFPSSPLPNLTTRLLFPQPSPSLSF